MGRERLDVRDRMPAGMEEYLSHNGWHFNKKLCEWAVSKMFKKKADGSKEKTQYVEFENIKNLFKSHNITIDNCVGYDVAYVYHMAKTDFYGTSIVNERHLLQYVKDYVDDPDGYDGLPMTRFYADCIGSGTPIMWEDVI